MVKKKAKLLFKHNSFDILEEGDFVLCAISGKKIKLENLNYWNMGKDDPSKRFINEQKKISNDKLVFLKVISNVIKSGMDIVGVDTPQKM